jgi:hypothetical protein
MMFLEAAYDNSVLWQMSPHERVAFIAIASLCPGENALEIGSYHGGSLRVLTEYFQNVISVDIDHKNLNKKVRLSGVDLMTGDSREIVPNLIELWNDSENELELILIDANHEYEYVLADLDNCLEYRPKKRTFILIHDSWYPPSRRAICDSVKLRNNKLVHFVDTDFCGGNYLNETTTIGGLCLIEMRSYEREGDLQIRQSLDRDYLLANR